MSDPNYLSVSLLLNFEGSDGSTTFTDSGPDALTVTPVGDVQIDTAQAPSGASSSGLFDGSGDYLTVPTNSKHALASGTKIFTIDGYIRPTAHSGIIAFAKGTSVITWATGNLEWLVYVNPSSALEFQMRNSTTTSATYSGGTISLGGVWQHFEIASDGTTVRGFLDGVQVFSESMTGLYSSVASPSLEVGRLGSAGLGFTGHMAPLRITPGVCRHTSAFTPPPAPFPDSSPVEEDALAIATPASIGITPGTGSATGQRNVTATATPASVSVTPGTGQALIKLDAVAVAVPASLSITPGTGRGVTGAALNYPTYKVVRDPYIDPIYNRGKIILSRPLSAGQRISIERKTPITQTVNFTRDDPFPAEGFEYAMDKITFIQQEIEGHACDCRNQDTKDEFEQEYYDKNPECRPYACDSYEDFLVANAEHVWVFDSENQPFPNLVQPDYPMSLTADGDSTAEYRFLDLYDSCGGKKFARFRNNSGSSGAQSQYADLFGGGNESYFIAATVLPTDFTPYTNQILHWSPRGLNSGYSNAGGDYYVEVVGGVFRIRAPYRPNEIYTYDTAVEYPADGEPHTIGIFVADSNGAGQRHWTLYLDWGPVASGSIPDGPPTSGAINNNVFFNVGRGDDAVAAYAIKADGSFNTSRAKIALQRNKSDYESPEYCIFPKD